MGRRRDYKPDPRVGELEYVDQHTRQTVKIVTINASTYFSHATKDAKMPSKWEAQTIARQRGKKSSYRRR